MKDKFSVKESKFQNDDLSGSKFQGFRADILVVELQPRSTTIVRADNHDSKKRLTSNSKEPA